MRVLVKKNVINFVNNTTRIGFDSYIIPFLKETVVASIDHYAQFLNLKDRNSFFSYYKANGQPPCLICHEIKSTVFLSYISSLPHTCEPRIIIIPDPPICEIEGQTPDQYDLYYQFSKIVEECDFHFKEDSKKPFKRVKCTAEESNAIIAMSNRIDT